MLNLGFFLRFLKIGPLARILFTFCLILYYTLYAYNANVLCIKLWTYLYISYVLDYYRFIIDLWKSDML